MAKHTVESIGQYYASRNTDPILPARAERLARAVELGASDKVLEELADAIRTSSQDTIVLPAHKYEGLSRGKGWARKGKGAKAVWGEKTEGGYRVGPGHWVVGGNDGFSRKGETSWDVKNVKVGDETWTVAT